MDLSIETVQEVVVRKMLCAVDMKQNSALEETFAILDRLFSTVGETSFNGPVDKVGSSENLLVNPEKPPSTDRDGTAAVCQMTPLKLVPDLSGFITESVFMRQFELVVGAALLPLSSDPTSKLLKPQLQAEDCKDDERLAKTQSHIQECQHGINASHVFHNEGSY